MNRCVKIKTILWPILTFVLVFWAAELKANFGPCDSLGTKVMNGKLCVVHEVDPGETLYKLSNRYKISEKDIRAFNKMSGAELAIGSLIYIPLEDVRWTPAESEGAHKPQTNEIHIVVEGNTLYSLSQQYNISVKQLKALNNLTSNSIWMGQRLKVAVEEADTSETEMLESAENQDATPPSNPDLEMSDKDTLTTSSTATVVEEETETDPKTQRKYEPRIPQNAVARVSDYTLKGKRFWNVTESGLIGWMETPGELAEKFYISHKELSPGIIVRIENKENGRTIAAETIGKLAETDEMMVRLTPQAARYLMIFSGETPQAELRYSLPAGQ